jgi:hypothetical protein
MARTHIQRIRSGTAHADPPQHKQPQAQGSGCFATRVQRGAKNIFHGQGAVWFVDVSISPSDINIFAVLMLT